MSSLEAREVTIKHRFREEVYSYLEAGQDLSMGDKLLVNQEVNAFMEDHKAATGKLPGYFWEDTCVWIIRERLQKFGFTMPDVEQSFRSRFSDIAHAVFNIGMHTGNIDAYRELMSLYLRPEVDNYYPKPRLKHPFPHKTWQQVIEEDFASCR